MTMYEELVKNLRYLAKVYSICENENTNEYRLAVEAADAIEDLVKKHEAQRKNLIALMNAHDWIPVTERLPKSGVHVLLACKCGGSSYVCDGFHTEKFSLEIAVWEDIEADYNEGTDEYYFPEGWWEVIKNWDDYSSVAIEDEVTHWMPLPDPPKEGE